MQYKRADRVSALIKHETSQIIIRELQDPDIGFVTITKVKMSRDLRFAKIYYSVLGGKDQQEKATAALSRSLKFIRGELGHRLNLRYVPEIRFYYDDSIEYADHIDKLLKKLH
ncbi:30S ribosome-binding factor RbfA [candidate division KSB1 bacterium]|nr:30S ribosome-binding factor RbfA [candidate division KSB1 bacterium]